MKERTVRKSPRKISRTNKGVIVKGLSGESLFVGEGIQEETKGIVCISGHGGRVQVKYTRSGREQVRVTANVRKGYQVS